MLFIGNASEEGTQNRVELNSVNGMQVVSRIHEHTHQRSARAEIVWPGPAQPDPFTARPVTYSARPVFNINFTCHNSVMIRVRIIYSHTNLTPNVLY